MPPRKGLNKELNKAKPSNKLTAVIEEGTLAYNISQELLDGKTPRQVAEKFGMTEGRIEKLMQGAMQALANETAHVVLNLTLISVARFERMIEKLGDSAWEETETGRLVPNMEVLSMLRQLQLDEVDIVQRLMPRGSADVNQGITATIGGGSRLHQEGTVALQNKITQGYVSREQEIIDLDDPFGGIGIITPNANS